MKHFKAICLFNNNNKRKKNLRHHLFGFQKLSTASRSLHQWMKFDYGIWFKAPENVVSALFFFSTLRMRRMSFHAWYIWWCYVLYESFVIQRITHIKGWWRVFKTVWLGEWFVRRNNIYIHLIYAVESLIPDYRPFYVACISACYTDMKQPRLSEHDEFLACRHVMCSAHEGVNEKTRNINMSVY